ncbi:MAG TPA: DnaJ domain-containing protein [Polyangiales bacterium]|nr:DnaJ domain-containing protein [Polyangiales bacterium]
MKALPPTVPAPPQARPHRLEPRYPVDCWLGVQVGDAAPQQYPTRDVSRGGLFLICAEPLELFSEVSVLLPAPEAPLQVAADELLPRVQPANQQLTAAAPARVVHRVSRERARATGVMGGMGLQFEPSKPEHHALIEAFVEHARKHDPRPRFPRPLARRREVTDPMLGYLLAAIDGRRGPEELADALGLPLPSTEDMLRELAQLGAIELVPLHAAAKREERPDTRPSLRPKRRRQLQGLSTELQAELGALWLQLGELDHYQVLGVSRAASRDEIRHNFFEMSKRFHPDAHYGVCQAEDLPKLERVFARLSEAYGVLTRPASRAEYDRYLDQKRTLHRLVTGWQPEAVSGEIPRTPGLAFRSQPTAANAPAAEQLWSELKERNEEREVIERLRTQAAYEEKHQRWAEAAESWQRVCATDPRDAHAHRKAALAAHHAGAEASAALALARRAVELQPEDAYCRRTLGQLYLAAGQKQKAREQFDAALELQDQTPTLPPEGELLITGTRG